VSKTIELNLLINWQKYSIDIAFAPWPKLKQ